MRRKGGTDTTHFAAFHNSPKKVWSRLFSFGPRATTNTVEFSTRRGIMASHREPPYADGNWDARLPETNRVTNETIILPLFHQRTEEEQDYILDSIREGASAA